IVDRAKVASARKRNLERREIAGAGRAVAGAWPFAWLRRWLAHDVEADAVSPIEREPRDDSDALDAGERAHTFPDPIQRRDARHLCLVVGVRKETPGRHEMLRLKPELNRHQLDETAAEERRAGHEHDRERDLGDHQRVAQCTGPRTAASALLQHLADVRPRL